jgi:LysR family transcriptional regulator, regulator for metE and metH
VLTAAGRRLLRSAVTILAELDEAQREIRNASAQPEGVLRVATECYTCYHWLPGTLEGFHEKFPGVDVQIVVEATHEPVPALLAGKIDLGIVSDPVKSRRVKLYPLFEDELVAVVSPRHRLASRHFVEAEDLAEETVLTYSGPREQLDVFTKVLWPAGRAPKKWIPMELTEAIVEMVAAGQGVGVLARWAIAPQLSAGTLVGRRLTRGGLSRQWSAAVLRRGNEAGYLAEFIRAMSRCRRHRVRMGQLQAVS